MMMYYIFTSYYIDIEHMNIIRIIVALDSNAVNSSNEKKIFST